jgi:hypothetical protein
MIVWICRQQYTPLAFVSMAKLPESKGINKKNRPPKKAVLIS